MKSNLFILHAQTAIHAGSGQSDNVIDLPVQRESHTGYPCIFGSSVKGALRAHAETRAENFTGNIAQLFGKEGDGDNGTAGAALISDARLLLLPIRSLTGQFRWVTCPAVLSRFTQDAKRFGITINLETPKVNSEQILLSGVGSEQTIYLEEYRFTKAGDIDSQWIKKLAKLIDYVNSEDMLNKQLAIISDEDFAYLARYTLPVNPHIAIDSKTKITKPGALWYEETLPSDSVLYIGIAIDNERKKDGKKAEELMNDFKSLFAEQKWLQLGGNETVGMGWCSIQTMEE